MCTEEGRLRRIGVALSFKVTNSRSWSKLEPADFRNGVRLVYHEGNIGTTSIRTTYGAEVCPGTAFPFLKCRARSLVNPAVIHEKHLGENISGIC